MAIIDHEGRLEPQPVRKLTDGATLQLAATSCTLDPGGRLAAEIFWSVGDGVLAQRLMVAMDGIYQGIEVLIPRDLAAPTGLLKSGSAARWPTERVWDRRARATAFLDAATIVRVAGTPAIEPWRVYVALNAAATANERADLALVELIRIGGFDRKLLVIATPTDTSRIDPASIFPLEFLWRGAVASVSVQYSYLASWLSLVLQPEHGHKPARAVSLASGTRRPRTNGHRFACMS